MARATRPDRENDATLAEGAVVRAHVVARLLGMKLLRLDATLVVVPPVQPQSPLIEPVVAAPVRPVASPATSNGGLPEAERLLRLALAQSPRHHS